MGKRRESLSRKRSRRAISLGPRPSQQPRPSLRRDSSHPERFGGLLPSGASEKQLRARRPCMVLEPPHWAPDLSAPAGGTRPPPAELVFPPQPPRGSNGKGWCGMAAAGPPAVRPGRVPSTAERDTGCGRASKTHVHKLFKKQQFAFLYSDLY